MKPCSANTFGEKWSPFSPIYFALEKFKEKSTFKTWTYRIIINQVNSYFRKLKVKFFFNYNLSDIDEVEISYKNQEEIFTYYDKIILYKAIISLRGKQRTVLLLRIYQSNSFKEISTYLNITENNAKVMFHQAKKSLAKRVKKYAR